ncbi:MAG: DUF2442 domain-containing protein [Gemmataceae bacterium]|nr:DUF2442 domain-containing protein [Gemmataceae bacterium]
MLQDIVEAIPLDDYQIKVRFEDVTTGVVDLRQCVSFTGIFAPLNDRAEFAAVQVNAELGTVCWPCGADLDPDVLYALVSGAPVPFLENASPPR